MVESMIAHAMTPAHDVANESRVLLGNRCQNEEVRMNASLIKKPQQGRQTFVQPPDSVRNEPRQILLDVNRETKVPDQLPSANRR
jgi:hypothetical protein